MELFQIVKRYIKHPVLNFQECYENLGSRAKGPGPYKRVGAGGWGPDKSKCRAFAVICFSLLYVTVYYKKWRVHFYEFSLSDLYEQV